MFEPSNKKKMSEQEQETKMKVLQDIMDHMDSMMKGDMDGAKGLKKVTVASDSPEGLKEGLKKAEEIVEKKDNRDPFEHMNPFHQGKFNSDKPTADREDENKEEDAYETVGDEETEEDLNHKIQALIAKKNKIGKKA